ncbi:hypothetical protein GCK32_011172 [Trichostrongylus colubriformis]|uniref:Uncharacterized protein n=1 Tax=Trichostrongylus colubriformis TaxID=6319 RepID=A0AAN8FNK8_TRICO
MLSNYGLIRLKEKGRHSSFSYIKPSPPNSGTNKSSKGEWDREWDHGKTPAETWRENVPSIETRKKPSGRGAHQWAPNQRGRRGGQKTRGRSEEPISQANKGSRLEGRVTHPEQNYGNRRGRGRGGSARNPARQVTKADGDLKINVKNGDETSNNHKPKRNTRQGARTSSNNKDDPTMSQNSPGKNRPRRRYTEKYEIKQLLRALVNKVEKVERKERQQKQRQLKENNAVDESKNTSTVAEVNDENTPPKETSEAAVKNEKKAENPTAKVAQPSAVNDESTATVATPTSVASGAPSAVEATVTNATATGDAVPASADANQKPLCSNKTSRFGHKSEFAWV